MSKILHQLEPERPAKVLPKDVYPLQVEWLSAAEPASINFSDGRTSAGSCIRCSPPPCMEYDYGELRLPTVPSFPGDMNDQVCPSSAITWPATSPSPSIDAEQCILCGVCVSRCPTRAIYLTKSGAVVNDESNDHFLEASEPANADLTYRTSSKFKSLRERGPYIYETDDLMEGFAARLGEVSGNQPSNFPNLLTRNLLNSVETRAAMRRRGDTNVRMDLLVQYLEGVLGPSEVEFGAAILDVPRDLLDDVAVLASRYRVAIGNIIPLAVCVSLPNQRSEYWEVLADIEKILKLAINTTTIGILALLVWNRRPLDVASVSMFRFAEDQVSMLPVVESIVTRKLNLIKGGYPGLFESVK